MANESRLLIKDTWLWAGSVVYADPLINPTVINCRYIPEEQLPAKERWLISKATGIAPGATGW